MLGLPNTKPFTIPNKYVLCQDEHNRATFKRQSDKHEAMITACNLKISFYLNRTREMPMRIINGI